jgi:hypothetical protein
MNHTFLRYIQQLDRKVDELLASPAYKYGSLPRRGVPKSGIYLFSDGPEHLYVGRSNRMRTRLGSHCRDSSRHNAASFAFRLARHDTGMTEAAYTSWGSRDVLSTDLEFVKSFREAKAYLKTLDIRFVEESHQTIQALLEIYAAIRLETPHNDFNTH